MRRAGQLTTNMTATLLQVVVNGGITFFLYRYVLDALGKELFGVWAVVLGTASVGKLADLGLAASAVKFVAQYLAREDRPAVLRVVETTVLSIGLVVGVVALVLYPVLYVVLGWIIQEAHLLPAARAILPYALATFWLTALSGAVRGCIDGFHRIDLRSIILMVATGSYLALALWLVPQHGLIGLAVAQVVQAGLLLLLAWGVLKALFRAVPWVPFRWSRTAFRELFGYSVKFQAIAVMQMLFEPITKSLLTIYGGTARAGDFELAQKLAFYLRSLIVNAHQAIVPTIADLHERAPALLREVYQRSYRIILLLLAVALPLLLVLLPQVSRLWLGSYQPIFVGYASLLLVGWFLNLLANPAYFANMGTGTLRWNVIGHVVIAVLNVGLGVVLGAWLGGIGVVIGFVVALVAGSFTILWAYQRAHHIPARALHDGATMVVVLIAGGAAGLLYLGYQAVFAAWPLWGTLLLVPLLYLVAVIVPLWRHPLRGWLLQRFPSTSDADG